MPATGVARGRHRRRPAACRRLSTLLGGLLWLAAEPLAFAYTDPAVRRVSLSLIGYIALYQFFDAVQTVAAYSLRGYKITFAPMLEHTVAFWASAFRRLVAGLPGAAADGCRGLLAGLAGEPRRRCCVDRRHPLAGAARRGARLAAARRRGGRRHRCRNLAWIKIALYGSRREAYNRQCLLFGEGSPCQPDPHSAPVCCSCCWPFRPRPPLMRCHGQLRAAAAAHRSGALRFLAPQAGRARPARRPPRRRQARKHRSAQGQPAGCRPLAQQRQVGAVHRRQLKGADLRNADLFHAIFDAADLAARALPGPISSAPT